MVTHSASNQGEWYSAMSAAVPGDVIELTGSTYPDMSLTNYGYADFITIKPAPGNTVTTGGIDFGGSNHIRFDGEDGTLRLMGGAHRFRFNTSFIEFHNIDRMESYLEFRGAKDIKFLHGLHNGSVSLKPEGGPRNQRIEFGWWTFDNNFGGGSSDHLQFAGIDGLHIHDFEMFGTVVSAGDHPDGIQGIDNTGGSKSTNVVIERFFLHEIPGRGPMQWVFLSDPANTGYGSPGDPLIVQDGIIVGTSGHGLTIHTSNGGNVITRRITCLQPIWISDPDTLILENCIATNFALNPTGSGGAAPAGNIRINMSDPTDTFHHSKLYANAGAGKNITIADFAPIPGGPADYGTGMGAESYINELLNGGQPMPDTITVTSIDSVNSTPAAPAATAVIEADNTITINPNDPDYVGQIDVVYTVTDTEGLTASATIFATFSGIAPTANDDVVAGPKGVAINLDPKLNDTAD